MRIERNRRADLVVQFDESSRFLRCANAAFVQFCQWCQSLDEPRRKRQIGHKFVFSPLELFSERLEILGNAIGARRLDGQFEQEIDKIVGAVESEQFVGATFSAIHDELVAK